MNENFQRKKIVWLKKRLKLYKFLENGSDMKSIKNISRKKKSKKERKKGRKKIFVNEWKIRGKIMEEKERITKWKKWKKKHQEKRSKKKEKKKVCGKRKKKRKKILKRKRE